MVAPPVAVMISNQRVALLSKSATEGLEWGSITSSSCCAGTSAAYFAAVKQEVILTQLSTSVGKLGAEPVSHAYSTTPASRILMLLISVLIAILIVNTTSLQE